MDVPTVAADQVRVSEHIELRALDHTRHFLEVASIGGV